MLRIDAISIFPQYFEPLRLSLLGKALDEGLVSFNTLDLRAFTEDKHHTVDSPPYGGGAGMVMQAEPWGKALDSVITPGATVIFTSPAGTVFTQQTAKTLSGSDHLIFACGRYEGFDQRIIDHYRVQPDLTVLEISIGDYVLNGGEVASMVMIEAITRLLPGFMGNPESLSEESHENNLLEYPSFTKPRIWRDLEVPEVLLSGNHAAIEKWRNEQRVLRTKSVRPDLLNLEDGLES